MSHEPIPELPSPSEPPTNGETAGVTRTNWLRLWFDFREPVDHVTYAKTGFALMLLKYVVEASVIFAVTGAFYSPWQFLVPTSATRDVIYRQMSQWFLLAQILWTLPFQWIAVSMSIRRSNAYGGSAWWGMIVLVPLINYVFMLFWCIPYKVDPRRAAQRGKALNKGRSPYTELLALSTGVATFLISMGLSVYGFGEYGLALFYGTPLMVGASTAFVLNCRHPRRRVGATVGFVLLTLLLCGLLLLSIALEGAICILMAAPIILVEGIFGALIGWLIALCPNSRPKDMLSCIALLPVLALLESHQPPAPVREVLSVVEIAAPPDVVWRNVVSFPELPPPTEWFFRAGIACPERARIEGHGAGATRYCEFSTGEFVEPIIVWDEPHRLAFDVTSQPPTMRELSPWGDIQSAAFGFCAQQPSRRVPFSAAAERSHTTRRPNLVRLRHGAASLLGRVG